MSTTHVILNYNMGNIYSIQNAIESLGFDVSIASTAEEIQRADKLIIPGVGAFGDAIHWLRKHNLVEAIRDFSIQGKPLLGICLGMQLLFECSEEGGHHQGLGLVEGVVKKFPEVETYLLPQMQWNKVKFQTESSLYNVLSTDAYFYFLHSYYVQAIDPSIVTATASYCGFDYCCSIEYRNIYGVQFHPEKSSDTGLVLLKNFCSL